jgi:NhaP-type Na+/H+ or K+/H+ antiporter
MADGDITNASDAAIAVGVLLLVIAVAAVGGKLSKLLNERFFETHPPLLGMMVFSFVLRNIPDSPVDRLPYTWSSVLRAVCLTVILLRAGLGLNLQKLRKLAGATFRLSLFPNMAEALVVAFVGIGIFSKYAMPFKVTLCLGFVLAAVSPAVVVPSLLDLSNRGYGLAKGIPSLVLAATSLDDVISICAFGITSSLVFASEGIGGQNTELWWMILRAPVELVGGVVVGVLAGVLLVLLQPFLNQRAQAKGESGEGGGKKGDSKSAHPLFLFLFVAVGLVLVFMSKQINMPGGGYLAAMTCAAVVAQKLDHSSSKNVAASATARAQFGVHAYVSGSLGTLWGWAQPVLFGLIGCAVKLSFIDGGQVGSAVAVIAIGLVVRFVVAYFSVSNASLESQEKLFVAVAWLPKATVQAAIGPEVGAGIVYGSTSIA